MLRPRCWLARWLCVRHMLVTFPPIFGLFAIFDRIFAKIVAPSSDKCENYVACLKLQFLPKKRCKPRRNRPINGNAMRVRIYAPLERTALRTRTEKKNTPHFRTYSRRALYDLPQTLHGDRARRAHHNRCIHFSIQRIVCPTWCTEKFGLIYRRAVSQQ